MTSLKQEIAQQPAFASDEEEALLNLLRTADVFDRTFQHRIKPWGVTATQYNVLRILRGAQPRGLTCSAIGERMITAEPDITRLVSRLKALKLVHQHRDRHDRRMVWTQISEAGLKLLREMDPMIERMPPELLGHMKKAEVTELTRLLEAARSRLESREDASGGQKPSRPTCDGGDRRPTGDAQGRPVTCEGREATKSGPASSDRRSLPPDPTE